MVTCTSASLTPLHEAKVERRLGKQIAAKHCLLETRDHCTHDLTEAGMAAEALHEKRSAKIQARLGRSSRAHSSAT